MDTSTLSLKIAQSKPSTFPIPTKFEVFKCKQIQKQNLCVPKKHNFEIKTVAAN